MTVALTRRRREESGCVVVTVGAAPLMSITTAPLVLPPNCRMRPGRNMAALESVPVGPLNCPAVANVPEPPVFT